MIQSNLPKLIIDKARERNQKRITYKMLQDEAHISNSTIARLMSNDPIERIDGKTLDGLCSYLGCQVGDILEYIPVNVDVGGVKE